MSSNLQNLTPYAANDGRTAERRKGGLISGYKRLQNKGKADVLYYLMLENEIKAFMQQNQNKPFGEKRTAKLKELAHRKKILTNRLKKQSAKVQRRRSVLLNDYGIEI